MKFGMTTFGLIAGFALLAGARADSLGLKWEKGRSYLFQVQAPTFGASGVEKGAEKSVEKDKERERGGAASDRKEPTDSPATDSTAKRSDETNSAVRPASVTGTGCAFEYRIQVQDTRNKETVLNVDINKGTPPVTGASDAARTDKDVKAEESSVRTASGGANALGTLQVTVDDNGLIKTITGWENLHWQSFGLKAVNSQGEQIGKSPAEVTTQPAGQPVHALTADERHRAFGQAILRNQLEVIFGGGLHDKSLDIGKYYYLRGTAATPHYLGAAGETERRETSKDQAGPTSNEAGRAPTSVVGGVVDHRTLNLSTVLYRYEGSAKVNDREMARFTVLVPEKNLGAVRSGQAASSDADQGAAAQTGQGRGQELSDQQLTQAGWKRVGEVSYGTKDGILETCKINFAGATGSFSSGTEPSTVGSGTGSSLTIRRLDLKETR